MNKGAKGLLASKRGTFCLLMLAASTALTLAHAITGQDWISFAKFLTASLVGSHTVELFQKKPDDPPTATVIK